MTELEARCSSADRADLARIALLCAREAGALVVAGYRSRPHAETKARHDLVTEYDRASEALLVSRLSSLAGGIPIVAEESADGSSPARAGLTWYVDPLDGTTNFVHGHPFWCVAVGLTDNGVPVLGAVVAPSLGLHWVGWVQDEAGVPTATRSGQPCRVSAVSQLDGAMIATGFPTVRDRSPEDNFDAFIRVKRAVQAVRRCGSAAIDLCFVADGTYDGYWERSLHAWDVVAGSAIVLAAGGRITALGGGAPRYDVGHIVATNGHIHDELVALLGE